MPFARPKLSELVTRVRSDLRGLLEVDGPLLRRAMLDAIGAAVAGVGHLLYGYLDWLAKQLSAKTSEREALLREAALYGIFPVPAAYAAGNIIATGTVGATVPTGAILRLDSGTSYRVTVGAALTGIAPSGSATLAVVSVLAGDEGNVPATTELKFESAIAGVDSIAVVDTGGIIGGADEEGTEEVRARYLLRLREPPTGGSDQDYEAWALAVSGVTRAWVYRNELGLGTVVVRFVLDGDPVSIFPDAGDVAAVQAKLEAERPTTAEVTAVAPTNLAVAFTLHIVPDNVDTRAAVAAELADLFKREAAPGNGAGQGTVLLSQIRTAIGTAAGVTDYALTVPAANVVPAVGELATVGVITWV